MTVVDRLGDSAALAKPGDVVAELGDAVIRKFVADDGAAIQSASTVIGGRASWGILLRLERLPSWSVWRPDSCGDLRPVGAMVIHRPLPSLGELHCLSTPLFPPFLALAMARWVVGQAAAIEILRLQAIVSRGHLAGHRLAKFAGLRLEHTLPHYFGRDDDGLLYATILGEAR